jgi:hypothetical protein
MTEDQIERRVEKMVDHLDRIFMAGLIDQASYDSQMADLQRWADRQYSWSAAEQRAARRT